jgi:hypothetical protein
MVMVPVKLPVVEPAADHFSLADNPSETLVIISRCFVAVRALGRCCSDPRFADHSARIARLLYNAKIWVATCTVGPLLGQVEPQLLRE